MTIKDRIQSVMRRRSGVIVANIRDELRQQGHTNTGKLEKSVRATTTQTSEEVALEIAMNDYHAYVERGVRKSRIPYGGKSTGKKKSKYIEGLKSYFLSKGKTEKEAQSAAFATAKTHKREGMPTRNSYTYSGNGRRLRFIDESTKASKEIGAIGDDVLAVFDIEANAIMDRFENGIAT